MLPSSFILCQTKTTSVFWQSWDLLDISDEGNSAPSSIQTLQGFTGNIKGDLVKSSDGTTKNGDLIELGYFDTGSDSPNTDGTNLFIGTWTPLTSTTTIGLYPTDATANSVDGLFYLTTQFSQNAPDGSDEKAKSLTFTSSRSFTDTIGASLDNDIAALNTATGGSNYARLGIRFYDISQTASTGGTSKANGTTRYNTIMAESWRWLDTSTTGAVMEIALHNPTNQAATAGLTFEFDNSDNNEFVAGESIGSKLTGGGSDFGVGTDDFVATISYYDGSSGLALNTIGSSVLSGLTGSGTITDGGTGKTLTLHSNTGNTGSNAYSFNGTITGDTKILKTGEGEQKLTSTLSTTDNTGFVYINDGILNLAPGSTGITQSMEYLTSATDLTGLDPIFALDNDSGSDQTVTFGLTHSDHENTDREFKGKVYLSDSGTNTINVASNSASGDYDKTQILSGVISGSNGGTAQAGSAKLKKTGVGRLQLSGSSANTFNGGVDVDDGVLVVGKNSGAGTGTITINKGKLEISSSVTVSNTIQGGTSNSKKSIIGGKGTVSSNIVIGDGSGEIDVISPGQGLSSSLTETSGLSKNQAPLGNVHAGGVGDSIGTFSTTGNLTLAGGGVFDWEIKDFHGGSAGTDWDVLAFNNLTFDAHGGGTKFVINILGLDSNGDAGAPADYGNFSGKTGTNGFLFLNGSSAPTWNGWDGNNDDGSNDINNYFDIRVDDYAFRTNHWHGDWSVYYDSAGNDFYLQYSAVPEPSTYIMVTGLLMLPGYNCLRRFRKKLNSTVTDSEAI